MQGEGEMTNEEISANEAMWILANLPISAPFGFDNVWMNHRNRVAKKLRAIINGHKLTANDVIGRPFEWSCSE